MAATIAEICNLNKIQPDLFGQHRGHSIYISFGGEINLLIKEMLSAMDVLMVWVDLYQFIPKINMYGHDGFIANSIERDHVWPLINLR